jgi:hypothetical protein
MSEEEWILAAADANEDEFLEMLDKRFAGLARAHRLSRTEAFRRVCIAFVRVHHPAVYSEVEGIIAACSNPARLHEWAVIAPEVDDARLVQRLRRESTLP